MKKTLALVLCLGLITVLLLACISTPEKIGEKKTQKGKSTKSLEFKAGDEIKIDLSPLDFKIQDSAGVRTTPSSYPDIPEAFPLVVELGPQGKLSGNLLFEVKAEDQPLKFIFRSSLFESEVVVNL